MLVNKYWSLDFLHSDEAGKLQLYICMGLISTLDFKFLIFYNVQLNILV